MITDLAAMMTRAPRVVKSGKTVNVYFEAIDMGESRQMFGLTAHHVILHERHVAEPGACSGNFEIDKEGWYVPRHSSTVRLGYLTYMLVAGNQCQDIVVKHGNFANPGMPLQETTITRYADPAGTAHVSSTSKEVLEFSTEPLEQRLFEVPNGFRKVSNVSWTEHLAYDWAQLESAFSSWVE